jgi:hypothetical protein
MENTEKREYKTVADFFPRLSNKNRKITSIEKAEWRELTKPINLDGCDFPAGAKYKVFETTNFGWVVIAPIPGYSGKRIFKY